MNPVQTDVFTYTPVKYDWIPITANSKSRRKDDQECPSDKDSWSLPKEENSLDYHEKLEKLLFEYHTLPCLHSDNFYKTTLEHPYALIWFPEKKCKFFHTCDIIT